MSCEKSDKIDAMEVSEKKVKVSSTFHIFINESTFRIICYHLFSFFSITA